VNKYPYSWSQLNRFSQCPRSYYYAYILRHFLPPGFALVDGKAYHKAMELGNHALIAKKALTAKQLRDLYLEDLETRIQKEEFVGTEKEIDLAREKSGVVFFEYKKKVYDELRPVTAEERFDVEIGGEPFCGVIDLVEDDGSISDYKRTGREKNAAQIAKSGQLHLYAHVKDTEKVGHIQLLVGKRIPEVAKTMVTVPKKRIARTVEWAKGQFKAIEAAKESGVWPQCGQDNWWCSARFCGYYGLCYGSST
jgi:hypothetical protein